MRPSSCSKGICMPRPSLNLFAALMACLAAWVGSAPANAQSAPVALAGQISPGIGGGTYASFGFVDVNRAGERLSDVVFSAAVSGGMAPGGLFVVSKTPSLSQQSRAIALVGDVAPGDPYPFPVTFAEFSGATIIYGEVAFLATFDVPGQTGGAGIYLADLNSGALTLVAKVGGSSPAGGVFQQLGVPSNHCGDVVFAAASGLSELVVTHGIFRSAGGVVSAVALEGDPAPGFGGAGIFESFGDPNCVYFSSANRVGFSANVVAAGSPSISGIFRYAGGTGELVAAQGDPSPDGVPYGAFSAESPGASFGKLGYTDGAGLFLFPENGSSTAGVMARLGQTAPRTGGGTFAAFARGPALRSTDIGTSLIAFAEVSGGSAPSGVFEFHRIPGFPLSVSAPAIVGDPAPGTGGGTWSAFSRPAAADAFNPYIGEDGVIAFSADVSSGTASSGVFILPEPKTLAARLAGAALLALLGARRRRTRVSGFSPPTVRSSPRRPRS